MRQLEVALDQTDRCSLAEAEIGRTTKTARMPQMRKATSILPTVAQARQRGVNTLISAAVPPAGHPVSLLLSINQLRSAETSQTPEIDAQRPLRCLC